MEQDPSADTRTRRQKMEAMALQTESSPNEAALARAWLDAHPIRTLRREDILAQPDDAPRRVTKYYDHYLRAWVVMEVEAASVYDINAAETLSGLGVD